MSKSSRSQPSQQIAAPYFIKKGLPLQPIKRIIRFLALKLGPFCSNRLYRDQQAIDEHMNDWLKISPPERLSQSELDQINATPWHLYETDIVNRLSVFETRPIERSMQGSIMPLLRRLLQEDPSIRSMTEIGAYHAYVLNVIANEFPQIELHGVDIHPNMERINAAFTAPNLRFTSGYAVDMLKRGELKGDVFLFISTATRLKHAELRQCLTLIAGHAKYIVFNELLTPLPGGLVLEPADLPSDSSVPVVYRGSSKESPPILMHNYKGMAESLGYTVLHYHTYLPSFTDIHRLYMIAKAPEIALTADSVIYD